MDMRLMFNEDAPLYDRLRPTYTAALFHEVIRFSGLDADGAALEIGIGTGQATPPFLRTGARIVAVEIGDRMAQYTREKFKGYENLTVINEDFEWVALEESSYDLVYSASAFHWIPPKIGMPKVHALLKSGGTFAWFSMHPGPDPAHRHVHEAVQAVYGRYAQFFGEKKPEIDPGLKRQQLERSRQDRAGTFARYGFVDVTDEVYHGARTFSAGDYAALLSTYSDHRAMPEESRIPFLKEIAEAIDRCGGAFTLSDTMLLCMGRKA